MDKWTILIGVVFMLFVLRGLWRGLSKELAPLAGLAVSAALMFLGYKPIFNGAMLLLSDSAEASAAFYSALSVAIVGLVLYWAISRLLRTILDFIVPQPFNAILGGVCGGLKGFFLISVVASIIWMVTDRAERFQAMRANNPIVDTAVDFWENRLGTTQEEHPDGGL